MGFSSRARTIPEIPQSDTAHDDRIPAVYTVYDLCQLRANPDNKFWPGGALFYHRNTFGKIPVIMIVWLTQHELLNL